MLAFHSRRGDPVLLLPRLVQGAGRQRTAAPPPGGGLVQAIDREPAHRARGRRVVRSGDRSPACLAIVRPLRRGRSLISAATYLPACSHVPVRRNAGLTSSISPARFRAASLTATLPAAVASDCSFVTQT